MSDSTTLLILFVGSAVNLAILVWFILTLNRICETLNQIEGTTKVVASYTRRSALADQLTQKQARILNKVYSIEELVNSLEKNGAQIKTLKYTYINPNEPVFKLKIENAGVADPEWSNLLMEQEEEAIQFMRNRASENS